MPKPKKQKVYLNVFANPFCVEEDHEGRAHGHVQFEPVFKAKDPRNALLPYVGCHLIATPKAKGEDGVPEPGTKLHIVVQSGQAEHAGWDHVWEYDTEPTLVPLTPYYLHHLRSHGHHGPALLPADEATYKHVHGTNDRWRAPHMRLHQYSRERDLIPQLRLPAEGPVLDAHTAHLAARKEDAKLPPRDHEAEWHAFVGEAVVKARLEHEQAHPQKVVEAAE